MKKFMILISLLYMNVFAEGDSVKFYKPLSYCSKVEHGGIEYKICTNEELANLDKKLSNIYSSLSSSSQDIESDHIAWIKQRELCKDSNCIKEAYNTRLNELNTYSSENVFYKRAFNFIKSLYKYGFSSKGYQESKRTSQDPDIRFGNFSSDGTKVLLNYRPIKDNDNRSYIGILNIIDNRLTLFNVPENYYMWYDGSFSPNSDEILFSFVENTKSERPLYGLGLLNLNHMTYKVIIKSETPMRSASFSSDASRIIYVGVNVDKYYAENIKRGKFSFDILELNMETKVIKSLTDITFITASSPQYYLNDKFIFSAEAPYVGKGHSLFKEHIEKYKGNDTYIFSHNKIAKTAVPTIIRGTNTSYVDLSKDNKQILCISLNKEPKYNYELFMYENGKMNQLTNIKSMIIDAALSPNAKQAVFVSDFSRQGERKIWQLNIDKNELSEIKLNSRNIIWKSIKKDK